MAIEYKPESGSKKFWRIVFGTIVGVFLSSVITTILSIFFLTGIMVAFSDAPTVVEKNSVLKVNLTQNITERTEDNPFEDLNLGAYSQSSIGLDDILKALNAAAADENISGVSLNLSRVSASPATLDEIRNAILRFKESGKFVYAYSETYSQGAYFIASAADKVFLHPKGELEFKGLAMQVMFYKGLLDKLDVDMQVVRHGKFKSAVEPYLMDKMSEANRNQMEVLCGSLWKTVTERISDSRRIPVDSLNYYADALIPGTAAEALQYNFVDELAYLSDYENFIKNKIALDEDKDVKYVSLEKYVKNCKNPKEKENKIAVVYAVGEIIDGKGTDNIIGSETLCRDIREAYRDEDVKAIVLRVNSPGGSALASETIWKEIELAKKAGKIVVTSMGDYAASGGYYISCNSDFIVAEANTLTGSIGVFGVLPNVQNFLKNKLGITVDVAKSNARSDCFSGFRPLDPTELARLQLSIEDCYATFIGHVATGRKMTVEQVDEIGQGRVWAGSDALQLGLVDKLGYLDDAIVEAAKLAKLSDYSVVDYPKKQTWFERLLMNDKDETSVLQSELGDLYEPYVALKRILAAKGVQARMPLAVVMD